MKLKLNVFNQIPKGKVFNLKEFEHLPVFGRLENHLSNGKELLYGILLPCSGGLMLEKATISEYRIVTVKTTKKKEIWGVFIEFNKHESNSSSIYKITRVTRRDAFGRGTKAYNLIKE